MTWYNPFSGALHLSAVLRGIPIIACLGATGPEGGFAEAFMAAEGDNVASSGDRGASTGIDEAGHSGAISTAGLRGTPD